MRLVNFVISLTIFSTIVLGFSSCIDDKIDMANLSSEMKLGGSVGIPLGFSTITIDDLVGNIEFDSTAKISVGRKDGLINLYYADTLNYTNPANVDFSSFGTIDKTITFGVTSGIDKVTSPIPAGDSLVMSTTENYDFNAINQNTDSQRVDSVRFYNTTISATVTTNLPANLASIYLHLPIEFTGQSNQVVHMKLTGGTTTKDFPLENFICRADGKTGTTFPIDVIVHGDGSTTINSSSYFIKINVSLKNTAFVAYGFFNYGTDVLQKNESLTMSLYNDLPDGMLLYPHNPEVKFNIQTNVGVPILLNLKKLQTFRNDTTPQQVTQATFNGLPNKTFELNAAPSYGATANTEIILNNNTDNGKTADLFKIKADSAATQFSFGIKPMAKTTGNQFVASNNSIKVIMNVTIPLWLDEGSKLSYSDTIDLDTTKIKDITDESIKEAGIRIKYTNKLPVGFKAYLRLLDNNNNMITGSSLYTYDIKSASVDAEGTVTEGKQDIYTIRFNRSDMDYLRKTKRLKMTYVAEGVSTLSKMKFRLTDYMKVQIGAFGVAEKSDF